ncbi:alpha-amylase family glycosyl hydrolase [Nostoc sp. MG11]|uniref:alpha-amylase family glycosyl hydrolase n=1 Tax=Nostoc sp. MG11 TaxID=2721166 RepID=UPI0018676A8A|nr:alpha-amylase family glycosyl hydrolase [Nostoc sp. MG11]
MAKVEEFAPQKLSEADLKPRGRVHLSPVSWRDQILYQLLPDRFSDGDENQRELFDRTNPLRFQVKDKASWMAAGNKFVGGTLKGVKSKLDYLQRLGVTTLWLNPPWRQRPDLETYHGYGIQNFLDIDPRFGTRQDLRDLIDAAHDRSMYVILDIIYNHSGNNWFYQDESGSSSTMPYRFSPPYPVHGWRSHNGESIPEIATPDDGVWPQEFQNLDWYTRAGEIGRWDVSYWEDPLSPNAEFRRGDFYDLKDLNLENNQVIAAIARVYQYWIALSDCDGFRIDAVKHVSPEDSRKFCTAIREYAQSIGKDNFLLTGEIASDTMAGAYIDIIGRNLSAVLDIISAPNDLTAMAKGLAQPKQFFDLYSEDKIAGKYRQIGLYHVSVLDDHDMLSRGWKQRFAAYSNVPNLYEQVAHVVGVQLTMPGIPSIYYGTEQAFDGNAGYHDYSAEGGRLAEDRYIREAMFGGAFGAFQTAGCHFFNIDHPTYLRIAAIAHIRNRQDKIGKALRRGHHYLRETSFCNYPFSIPGQGEVVAWSQILFDTEVLMVLNTHGLEGRGAEVTVDTFIHPHNSTMTFLYKSDWSDSQLRHPPRDQTVAVQHHNDARATVRIDLPPSGMAILV